MAFIDILIVLGVVLFAASRFFAHKLPKDDRPKGSGKKDWESLLQRTRPPEATEAAKPAGPKKARPSLAEIKAENAKNLTGLEKIRALDESFDEERFIEGVKTAYRYFYDRWNAADEEGLDALCGPQLLAELSARLEALAKRGVRQTVVVEDVPAVEIKSARVNGRTAVIDVVVYARQSETEGPLGEKNTVSAPHAAQSRWVLARALSSDDPNWELQSIHPAGLQA